VGDFLGREVGVLGADESSSPGNDRSRIRRAGADSVARVESGAVDVDGRRYDINFRPGNRYRGVISCPVYSSNSNYSFLNGWVADKGILWPVSSSGNNSDVCRDCGADCSNQT